MTIIKIIIENRLLFEDLSFQEKFTENAKLLLASKGIYFPASWISPTEKAFYFSYESPQGYKLTLQEIWDYTPSFYAEFFGSENSSILSDTIQQGTADTIQDLAIAGYSTGTVILIILAGYIMMPYLFRGK